MARRVASERRLAKLFKRNEAGERNEAVTVQDIQSAAERERIRNEARLSRAIHGAQPTTLHVTDVAFYDSPEQLAEAFRHDCAFPGCQLSLGHPPPHCCSWASRPGVYLMIDDDGVLREL